jgi:hypothetical protein
VVAFSAAGGFGGSPQPIVDGKGWWFTCCSANNVAPQPPATLPAASARPEGFNIFDAEHNVLSVAALLEKARFAAMLMPDEKVVIDRLFQRMEIVGDPVCMWSEYEVIIAFGNPFLDLLTGQAGLDMASQDQRFAYFVKAIVDGADLFAKLLEVSDIVVGGIALSGLKRSEARALCKYLLQHAEFVAWLSEGMNRDWYDAHSLRVVTITSGRRRMVKRLLCGVLIGTFGNIQSRHAAIAPDDKPSAATFTKGWLCCGNHSVKIKPQKPVFSKFYTSGWQEGKIKSNDDLIVEAKPFLALTIDEQRAIELNDHLVINVEKALLNHSRVRCKLKKDFLSLLTGEVGQDASFPHHRFAYILEAIIDGGNNYQAVLQEFEYLAIGGYSLKTVELGGEMDLSLSRALFKLLMSDTAFARAFARKVNVDDWKNVFGGDGCFALGPSNY